MTARILKFIFAFGLIALLFNKGVLNLAALKDLTTPRSLTALMAVGGMGLALGNWRWMVLLKCQNLPSSTVTTFPLTLIGLFFSYALPGAVGGDVVKAYYVAQDNPRRKMTAVTTVLVDRVVGLYCMTAMALVALLLDLRLVFADSSLQAVAAFLVALFLGQTSFFVLVFSQGLSRALKVEQRLKAMPMGGKFYAIYEAFHLFAHQRMALFWAVILSTVSQLFAVLFIYVVAWLLHDQTVPLETFLFAVPVGFILSSIPISPAGIGVGQVAFAFLFRLHSHTDTSLGQTSITAYQMAMFLWGLIGAGFYMARKKPAALEEANLPVT